MRKFIAKFAVAAGASLFFTVAAWAGATRAEAQEQVAAAVAHFKKVGVDQGVKDINNDPEWKTKGMNVIVDDFKANVLASSLNPRLVGKATWESKDPSGREYAKEFVSTAQKGEGWVDYQFINPETKKLEDRSMFIRRIPGFDGFVGVAITR